MNRRGVLASIPFIFSSAAYANTGPKKERDESVERWLVKPFKAPATDRTPLNVKLGEPLTFNLNYLDDTCYVILNDDFVVTDNTNAFGPRHTKVDVGANLVKGSNYLNILIINVNGPWRFQGSVDVNGIPNPNMTWSVGGGGEGRGLMWAYSREIRAA